MTGIPIIDTLPLRGPDGTDRARTVDAILEACTSVGFLTIVGTGVSTQGVQAMRDCVRAIFAVDEAAKRRQSISRENYRGYIPMGFFAPNDGSGGPDGYEGYKLHAEVAADDPIRAVCPLYGPNLWPKEVPQARDVILSYWRRMDEVALRLLRALADGLGLPPAALLDPFERPLTNMTLLHYPPQRPEDKGFGIHPHKDTDALTIIAPDPAGGLEIKTARGWIAPDCPADGFIVNIGDMLELWSGGRLVSTQHRVVNRSGRERFSFPYFAVPGHDTVVRPLLSPVPGFDRPAVHCGHWSAEIWRTNWPEEAARDDTPELGTVHD